MRILQSLTGGFTLIEMIVVVGILMLVSGGSIVAITGFKGRQGVQVVANDVSTYFRKVQAKATAIDVPPGCNEITNYAVLYSAPGNFITTVNCANGSFDSSSYAELNAVNLQIPDGYVVTMTPNQVVFDSKTGGVTAATVDVCNDDVLYRFTINRVGTVGRPALVPGGC